MEQEGVRVIKKSPDWIPAVELGKKVKAYKRQPIGFIVLDK
jgi:periplasmic protein TonB